MNNSNNPTTQPDNQNKNTKPQKEIDVLTNALLGKSDKTVSEMSQSTEERPVATETPNKVAGEKIAEIAPSVTPVAPAPSQESQEKNEQDKETSVETNTPTEKPANDLEAARRALEGPENTDKRLKEEKSQVLEKRKKEIEDELSKIDKEKEAHELRWVELDNQKKELVEIVKPIREKEEKIESEEAALEEQEKRTPYPKQRHDIETKRWETTTARRATEEEKWAIEKKIVAIEEEVAEMTKVYQTILDREDALETEFREINKKLDNLI